MTRGTWITAALVSALSLTAVAALAHDGKGKRGADHERVNFEQLDADSDGKVTLEEMLAHRNARFAAADTNGDGLLNAEEMLAQHEGKRSGRVERMIDRMDQNDDGLLSIEEMQGRRDPARMFERVDANADGAVTAEEFADARKMMRGHGGRHGKNDQ